MKEQTITATVAMLVVIGCTSNTTIDMDAERAALVAAATAYHAAASAKDAQSVVTFYADDAMMIPPNADLVEGIDGVRDYRFGFIETPGVALQFETIRVEVSAAGDLGWTLAIGDVTIDRPEGQPGRDRVRDFHAWEKQADGSWKIVVDVWNSGLPAAGS